MLEQRLASTHGRSPVPLSSAHARLFFLLRSIGTPLQRHQAPSRGIDEEPLHRQAKPRASICFRPARAKRGPESSSEPWVENRIAQRPAGCPRGRTSCARPSLLDGPFDGISSPAPSLFAFRASSRGAGFHGAAAGIQGILEELILLLSRARRPSQARVMPRADV